MRILPIVAAAAAAAGAGPTDSPRSSRSCAKPMEKLLVILIVLAIGSTIIDAVDAASVRPPSFPDPLPSLSRCPYCVSACSTGLPPRLPFQALSPVDALSWFSLR